MAQYSNELKNSSSMKIRQATVDDAAQINEIYGPFCVNSTVSFETEAPSIEEMAQRIAKCNQRFPWLVCERDGVILGYAYSSAHRERPAHQWSVEASAYVRDGHRGAGMGRALYSALFDVLRQQGFYRVYAGISLPNFASVSLHEAMGFSEVGVYQGVGYKAGAWRDVGRWVLALQPQDQPPAGEPKSVTEVIGTSGWNAAIAAGESLLIDPLKELR